MNKKSIIYIILGVICAIVVLACVLVILNSKKTDTDGNGNGNGNNPTGEQISNTNADIKNLSLNGIKLGDKIKEEQKNVLLDYYGYEYRYNNILISTDQNDIINELCFYTSESGDKKTGVKDINVMYNNTKLNTIDDFKNVFGEGNSDDSSQSYSNIEYTKDDYILILTVYNEELINIKLSKMEN